MGCASSQDSQPPPPEKSAEVGKSNARRASAASNEADIGLREEFEYIKPLGQGGTGVTLLFKVRRTGDLVAIKLIKRPLPKIIIPNILREITIQAELGEGHVNVIEAKEVLLTESHLALVMEYAAGNSLTGYVADKWVNSQKTGLFLTEDEARYFFRQFIHAVGYCHEHNVAHRDLKLDNTLLDNNKPQRIKLCDFGFAKSWDNLNRNMFTHIGTPVYMSPEQLNQAGGDQGYSGTAVDVWASGVLLIVMLIGAFPFDHIDNPDPNSAAAHDEVFRQQTGEKWSEVPHIAKAVSNLSPGCMDLLNKILVPDEAARITVEDIEAHPWYCQPLSERLARAEAAITADQAQVDAVQKKARISMSAKIARDALLKEMVDMAATRPESGVASKTVAEVRIDLRQSAVMERALSGPLPTFHEDEEE